MSWVCKRLAIAAIAAALVGGCSAPRLVTAPVASATATPQECSRAIAEPIVRDFAAAFSRQDPSAAATYFDDRLRSDSVTDNNTGQTMVARDMTALQAYFADRYAHKEELVVLFVNSRPGYETGTLGVDYRLDRRADDLDPATPAVDGKGTVRCSTRKIEAWGMAWPSGCDPAVLTQCN